jgi:hypothetical protein
MSGPKRAEEAMYCPACSHPNAADADECALCHANTRTFRERVFIGGQFIFVQADKAHPIALKVDGSVQTYHAPAAISRHQHAVSFGDEPPKDQGRRIAPLPDQPQLAHPSLDLLTVVADRKIYKPGDVASLFVVAPDAAGRDAALEIQLAGQKVYEAQVALSQDGLALHHYADLKEGEYTAVVTLANNVRATCTFSAAEFTLSPLIAVLEKHKYENRRLAFTLKLLLLSAPYSGEVEFGLQCQVCGERVVATQKVQAKNGTANGEFDLSSHGGPFHVQVTTPDGNTALVAFPGTGASEREHLRINPLGQTAEAGLLPWEDAQPVRGFYVGSGEVNMTPLMLESVHVARAKLKAAADIAPAQVVTFNPRTRTNQSIDYVNIGRGETVEFDVDAPYTVFTVGAFTKNGPFEGWGIVIRPVAFEATLTAPATARPGQAIDVQIDLSSLDASRSTLPAFCWLLAYDARLEHESPVPRLAKCIYESVRAATNQLAVGQAPDGHDQRWAPPRPPTAVLGRIAAGATPLAAAAPMPMEISARRARRADVDMLQTFASRSLSAPAAADVEAPVMIVAPTRMEFPELVYNELFYMEGQAARTVKLGDQIGTWRVRAYVFQGADYRELTADVQADKPLYAELDLPAIASPGDDISAAVNYATRRPAELVIATAWDETRARVSGSGMQRFAIQGPGRVEVRLEGEDGSDWTVRDVAPPGVQKVTASRLLILDKGQTARGEKVVIYASMGQVLKDTITALIAYPFG